jgi:hypothetical protein
LGFVVHGFSGLRLEGDKVLDFVVA